MVFTFSAPFITPEQELAERNALTEEELEQLRRDTYGEDAPPLPENPSTVAQALRLFQEALQSLDAFSKTAYLQALEQVPELVEQESNPIAFLRACQYDAWAAATRLVEYWTLRLELFADKAFEPMTADGAMRDDMSFLKKAIIIRLGADAHNRPVLYLDRMRWVASVAPRDSIVRCLFYAIQTLSREETTQRFGYVLLIDMKGYDLYKHFDRTLSRKGQKCAAVAPCSYKATHAYWTGPGRTVLDAVVLPVLKHMAGKYARLRFHSHSGSSRQVLASLEKVGLGQAHVDCLFGGLLSNGTLATKWLEQCRSEELGSDAIAPVSTTETLVEGWDPSFDDLALKIGA